MESFQGHAEYIERLKEADQIQATIMMYLLPNGRQQYPLHPPFPWGGGILCKKIDQGILLVLLFSDGRKDQCIILTEKLRNMKQAPYMVKCSRDQGAHTSIVIPEHIKAALDHAVTDVEATPAPVANELRSAQKRYKFIMR